MNQEQLEQAAREYATANEYKWNYHEAIRLAFIAGKEYWEGQRELEEEESEPYFGWCDVDGCDKEGCSGGNAWRKSGYWKVCYKHSADFRSGLPQPKMKQSAIDREASRDENGYLPAKPNQ